MCTDIFSTRQGLLFESFPELFWLCLFTGSTFFMQHFKLKAIVMKLKIDAMDNCFFLLRDEIFSHALRRVEDFFVSYEIRRLYTVL